MAISKKVTSITGGKKTPLIWPYYLSWIYLNYISDDFLIVKSLNVYSVPHNYDKPCTFFLGKPCTFILPYPSHIQGVLYIIGTMYHQKELFNCYIHNRPTHFRSIFPVIPYYGRASFYPNHNLILILNNTNFDRVASKCVTHHNGSTAG